MYVVWTFEYERTINFSKTLCNLCVDDFTVYSGYPIYRSFKTRHEFIWNDILQKISVKFQKKGHEIAINLCMICLITFRTPLSRILCMVYQR